jgi:hypothetical protein
MLLLLNSGSVVRICVGSVVSSIAHASVVKMDADRKSAACQVGNAGVLGGEMRGV